MTSARIPFEALFGRGLRIRVSAPFIAFCLVLAAGFALGGGSRGDLASLMVLRPLSLVLLGYGLCGLRWPDIRANFFLFAMALAIVLLVAAHLVPLPPAWWSGLPGREIIVEIDRAAGIGRVWRPLSMAPDTTLNALFALALPLAALTIGVRLDQRERFLLLGVLLAVGALNGLLAVGQLLGGRGGPLYLYAITNADSAVGLFANRNHQAMFSACLLPVAAVWAGHTKSGFAFAGWRGFVALSCGLCLLPLILITGSRLGVVTVIFGLVLIPLIFLGSAGSWLPRAARSAGRDAFVVRPWIALLLAAAVIGATIWAGRDLAWHRLAEATSLEDSRTRILPTLTAMIARYMPLGTGIGSFDQAYRLNEPDGLLDTVYMNHAHNDWLEVLLVAGLPGALLMAAAAAGLCVKGRHLYARGARVSEQLRVERLGLAVILLIAAASLADYPLRVPSLAVTFVVALLWASPPARPDPLEGGAR